MNIIFVAGTNTGIGKTTIARALVSYIANLGHRVAGFKPVETGCALSANSDLPIPGLPQAANQSSSSTKKAREALKRLQELTGSGSSINLDAPNDHLVPADGEYLQMVSNVNSTIDEINPFRYSAPVAPSVASRLARRPVAISDLCEAMETFEDKVDYLVIEGAGGLLVPLNERELMIDFMAAVVSKTATKATNCNTLLVGASSLGTINHCLLSLAALQNRNIPCSGIILNRLEKTLKPEEASNPDQIESFSKDCPVLGVFPYFEEIENITTEELGRKINIHVDLSSIL